MRMEVAQEKFKKRKKKKKGNDYEGSFACS
jgi:hypothetical protein